MRSRASFVQVRVESEHVVDVKEVLVGAYDESRMFLVVS
jgi:hypothetical protein